MHPDVTSKHLALALQHLVDAQSAADRYAADVYITEVPAGRCTIYAAAECKCSRIALIRGLVRQLLGRASDSSHSARTVEPGAADIFADLS
jgi:hypothetical protein